jgi:hypothetical protein
MDLQRVRWLGFLSHQAPTCSCRRGTQGTPVLPHIDSVSAAGLIIDDAWKDNRVITIDLLGDEFLETLKNGDRVAIHRGDRYDRDE